MKYRSDTLYRGRPVMDVSEINPGLGFARKLEMRLAKLLGWRFYVQDECFFLTMRRWRNSDYLVFVDRKVIRKDAPSIQKLTEGRVTGQEGGEEP